MRTDRPSTNPRVRPEACTGDPVGGTYRRCCGLASVLRDRHLRPLLAVPAPSEHGRAGPRPQPPPGTWREVVDIVPPLPASLPASRLCVRSPTATGCEAPKRFSASASAYMVTA